MSRVVDISIGKLAFKMAFDEANQCDVDLSECLRRFGSPEPEVVDAMFHIVRPGDTVIDGGANMGFFTLVLSRLVGDGGRVVAVEPGGNNIGELELNLSLNGLRNVTVVTKPLWGSHAKKQFHLGYHGGVNSFGKYAAHDRSMELDTVMLSDLVVDGPPRLIKLDIEGAEGDVLRTFKPGAPFVISELNQKSLERLGSSRESVRDTMRHHGYDTFLLLAGISLPVYVPQNTQIKTEVEALNVLFSTCYAVGEAWTNVELVPGDDPK